MLDYIYQCIFNGRNSFIYLSTTNLGCVMFFCLFRAFHVPFYHFLHSTLLLQNQKHATSPSTPARIVVPMVPRNSWVLMICYLKHWFIEGKIIVKKQKLYLKKLQLSSPIGFSRRFLLFNKERKIVGIYTGNFLYTFWYIQAYMFRPWYLISFYFYHIRLGLLQLHFYKSLFLWLVNRFFE